ncbi:MAG: hypothetical protein LBH15_08340 [Treponema sp.]|jgi:hypothetical protein|nr:hypothetical protein [Treponema sp.]
MKKRHAILVLVLMGRALLVPAQEDAGFGFGGVEDTDAGFGFGPDGGGSGPSAAPLAGARIGGKVSAGITFFPDDFLAKGDEGALDRAKKAELGDIFSGELSFSAEASNADAVINLRLSPNFKEPAEILLFDEAYIRAFFGKLMVEGGLRKLTWGRADSFGPLDLTNPFDYSDMSRMTDFSALKIARPMLRASWGIGLFTKIEGVFVPWFEGDRFAGQGRWKPLQLRQAERIPGRVEEKLISDLAPLARTLPPGFGLTFDDLIAIMPQSDAPFSGPAELIPATSSLEYFQGGLRFTTTLGPADFGAQYYYGLHSRPSYRIGPGAYDNLKETLIAYYTSYIFAKGIGNSDDDAAAAAEPYKAAVEAAMNPSALFDVTYNRYHHIGVDYAQVLFGFNARAELAANITGDLSGDDGLVYNPALAWSLGFDRDIPVVRINANFQLNGKITLLHDRLGTDPLFDVEAGSRPTSTRLTLRLSRAFVQDKLELRAAAIWGIEDRDCYLIPSVTWTEGDLSLEVAGGIFAGDRDGGLGQYRDNYFVKTLLSYSF